MHDLLYNLPLALVFGLLAVVADIVTTQFALGRGAREVNPIVAWLMDRFGRGWIMIKIVGSAVAFGLMALGGAVPLIWALGALLALIAWRNHKLER